MQAEHRELDACFDAVRTALHDEDGARAAAAVEGLQRLLEAHFESEELLYYPPLRALRPDREPALEGFTRDHEELCAQLLQALVASRLLKYGGFAAILLAMPVIALASYTTMALLPVLAVVKVMKIAENSTDYSINNTARHVLWLPVTAEMKYKGKPTIDTLFVRMGDGLAALTVLIGVQVLALSTGAYFAFTVALALAWIVLALVVVRENRRLTEENSRAD